MRVLIDENKLNFSGYVHLKRLEDLKEVKGEIEYLILGNLRDVSTSVLTFLTSFCANNKPENIIYIASPKQTNLGMKTCVLGLGGKYYDDDFFLSSKEELENLLREKENINQLIQLPGEGILKDFKKRFDEGKLKSPTPQYLSVVSNALDDVTKEYKNKQNEIQLISQQTISIFKDISEITKSQTNELDLLQEELEKVIAKVESGEFSESNSSELLDKDKGMVFFPRIQVREGTKKIIKIKDLRNTKYLQSFLLGFVKYLFEVRYLKPKLIVIEPMSELNEILYKGFTFINKDNFTKTELYTKRNIIFTSHPTINVMNLLLNEDVKDVFIIVDRTTNFKDHLLKGNGVFFASNSRNTLDKLKVDNNLRICSEISEDNFINLKRIENYSDDKIMRERQYLDNFKEEYEKLVRRLIYER